MIEKAKAPPIQAEEVDLRLKKIGRATVRLQALEAELNEEIGRVRSRYAARLDGLNELITTGTQALRLACEDSKRDLLPARRKRLDLLFGSVGWRTQPDRILTARGVSADQAAAFLMVAGLNDCIRARYEPAKDVIRARLAGGDIAAEVLQRCGLRVMPGGEDWYYALNLDEVRKAEVG